MVGIVVDPVETNAKLARDLDLTFPLLADPALEAIDAYGLRHVGGHGEHDIAHPASILIDAAGVIRWRNVAEAVNNRPTPATILAAIDALEDAGPPTAR